MPKTTIKRMTEVLSEEKTSRPKASNGSGSLRQKKNGNWELRYTQDGKQKSKSFKSFTEADKARRQITAAVDAGTYVDPSKMRLEDWLKTWLESYCGHIKPGTLVQYQGYVKTHINPELGKIKLCNLRPHRVQQFVNELSYHGKQKDGELAYKTRKNVHGCLSAALAKAVQIKYIPENPATGCSIPKELREENDKVINPFTTEELSAFLVQTDGTRFKDIYDFALGTGMRLSEILGLRWSRVNLKNETITVDSQLAILREKGGKRKLAPTKYENTRTFKAAKSVMKLLQRIKKQQAKDKLAAGSAWAWEIEGLVFTDVIGNTIPHASVEHEFKKLVTAAGCPEHRFHDLRHTFATLALQNHADVKTLSRALGHRSVAFTLDVYGHVSEEMSEGFADLVENIISSR